MSAFCADIFSFLVTLSERQIADFKRKLLKPHLQLWHADDVVENYRNQKRSDSRSNIIYELLSGAPRPITDQAQSVEENYGNSSWDVFKSTDDLFKRWTEFIVIVSLAWNSLHRTLRWIKAPPSHYFAHACYSCTFAANGRDCVILCHWVFSWARSQQSASWETARRYCKAPYMLRLCQSVLHLQRVTQSHSCYVRVFWY